MKTIFDFPIETEINNIEYTYDDLFVKVLQIDPRYRSLICTYENGKIILDKKSSKKLIRDWVNWFNKNPVVIRNLYDMKYIHLFTSIFESQQEIILVFNEECHDFIMAIKNAVTKFEFDHKNISSIFCPHLYSSRLLKYIIDNNFPLSINFDLNQLIEIFQFENLNSYQSIRIIEIKIIKGMIKEFESLGIQLTFDRYPKTCSKFALINLDYENILF